MMKTVVVASQRLILSLAILWLDSFEMFFLKFPYRAVTIFSQIFIDFCGLFGVLYSLILMPSQDDRKTFNEMRIDSGTNAGDPNDSIITSDLIPRKEEPTLLGGAKEVLINGPLNIMFLCVPFAIMSDSLGWGDGFTFVLSLLALAPLAERLGFITEQLANHTNETIGGLLNATFGNATELIVAIAALYKGLYRLVQLSLLGSVLSNMLLVLGSAFFVGGLRTKTQYYGKISSQVNSTLLILATGGVLFPTILTLSGQESNLGQLGFSRGTSIVLLITYLAFLYFQLFSHKEAYEERSEEYLASRKKAADARKKADPESGLRDSLLNNGEDKPKAINDASTDTEGDEDDDDEEEEEDLLGFKPAIFWLGFITVFIAILSELISSSIEDGAKSMGISPIFLAAIVLPIVGNAAEHAGAILFAWKGKLDLSLGVAIGSSTQIALFVLPFLVLLGWMSGKNLSLEFGSYESFSLLLTILIVTFAIKDGKSNWLLGFGLVMMYIIISIGFYADSNNDL